MPPRPFTSSDQSRYPSWQYFAESEKRPVSDSEAPSLIGSAARALPPTPVASAAAPRPSTPRRESQVILPSVSRAAVDAGLVPVALVSIHSGAVALSSGPGHDLIRA